MSKSLNQTEIANISTLGRKFSDATILMHEAIARRAGLSGTDHKYLGLLMQHGAMTAGDLAKHTGLTTGAITGVVDRLEKKGLVKRAFDKEDRRKIVIVPDYDACQSLLNPLFTELQSRMVKLILGLSEQEKQIIEKYMLATIEVMEDITQNLK
jgi:DNA-binding MarR family transcriptional regulator